jgi:hypothetical protein
VESPTTLVFVAGFHRIAAFKGVFLDTACYLQKSCSPLLLSAGLIRIVGTRIASSPPLRSYAMTLLYRWNLRPTGYLFSVRARWRTWRGRLVVLDAYAMIWSYPFFSFVLPVRFFLLLLSVFFDSALSLLVSFHAHAQASACSRWLIFTFARSCLLSDVSLCLCVCILSVRSGVRCTNTHRDDIAVFVVTRRLLILHHECPRVSRMGLSWIYCCVHPSSPRWSR